MHPCSPALAAMVARKTAQARLADPYLATPAELERHLFRALSDLARTRPRIVEFAPETALRRALERVNETARFEWERAMTRPARGNAQGMTATS